MTSVRDSRRCVRSLVDLHFAKRIDPKGEQELRAHLPGCEACRRYYERHLLLEKVDPAGFGAQARLSWGLGLRPPKRPVWAWSIALACSAAVALLAVRPRAAPGPGDFTPRGGAAPEGAELFAYRTSPTAARLGPHAIIQPSDGLAFAYTNAAGFARLLVYGVDEHRHVYWYYPAWTNAADEPRAIGITAGPELRELPEAIRHDLDGHELTIHAIFLDADVSVGSVERLVAGLSAPDDPASIDASYELRLPLEVEH